MSNNTIGPKPPITPSNEPDVHGQKEQKTEGSLSGKSVKIQTSTNSSVPITAPAFRQLRDLFARLGETISMGGTQLNAKVGQLLAEIRTLFQSLYPASKSAEQNAPPKGTAPASKSSVEGGIPKGLEGFQNNATVQNDKFSLEGAKGLLSRAREDSLVQFTKDFTRESLYMLNDKVLIDVKDHDREAKLDSSREALEKKFGPHGFENITALMTQASAGPDILAYIMSKSDFQYMGAAAENAPIEYHIEDKGSDVQLRTRYDFKIRKADNPEKSVGYISLERTMVMSKADFQQSQTGKSINDTAPSLTITDTISKLSPTVEQARANIKK